MITLRGAKVAGSLFLLVSIALAINYTFIDPRWFKSLFCISLCFTFYFVHRNPNFLMVRNWNEAMDQYDSLRDKEFINGTTPLYPATILLALLYIAWAKQAWPFD